MGARRTPPPAKISRPRLYGASPRTRLFARLDALRERPVIWVAGPPGAGKTTLVASYLEARGIDGLWLQVDRSDVDPATFFYYLGLAARPLAPKAKPLPLVSKEFLSDLDGFARNFFRLLFERMGESSVLVLDNVHEVPEKSGFSRLLELASEEAPQGSNLIILSRHGVPVELARAEANHLVGHLEWEDLRVTQDEATLIARTRQPVTDSVIARLHADCDGWAAGLTLMLDRLQRTGTIPESAGPANRETIFNYFAREILEHVTPREERTLCISSLLPEMTARSVQDLTEDTEAGALLDNLYRRHLFTYRREGNEPVFQFHALFRAFLLARLDELHGDERASLRLQAAQVLEKEGTIDGAIALYIQSEDMTGAIRLMLSRAEEMMAQGRSQTLKDWINVLPESRLEENPWLRYWLGVAELATVPDQAQETLTKAYEGFESRNDIAGKILVASAILHAFYVSYARFSPAKEWITLLSGLLKTGHVLRTRGAELQANAVMLLANLYRNANPAEVDYWVGNLERLLKDQAPARDKLMAGIALLSYAVVARRCDTGWRLMPLMVELERRPDISEPTLIMWLIRKADFLHNTLEFQSAIDAARQARNLARERGLRYAQLFACFIEGQAHLKTQEFNEVDLLIEEMQPLCDRSRRIELLHASGCLPWRHVWLNNPIDALNDGQIAFDVAKATRVPYFIAVWSIPVLYGYAGAGRYAEAMQLLVDTRETLSGTVCQDPFEIVLLIVEAYCMQRTGDSAKAASLTRQALSLSRQFGREVLVNWIPPLGPIVLRDLLIQGTDTEQVRKVIRMLKLSPPTDSMDPDWAWEMSVRTLGGFEIVRDGHVVAFSGKLPKKSLLLLKAIIAFGPGDVSEQQVLDALWPDEEGDVAQKSLSVTLLRLRRLLGDNDLIRHQGGRLSLGQRRCWVDAWTFEHLLSAPGAKGETNLELQEKPLSLYGGSFLPDDGEEPWSVPARERLRAKFVHSLVALGKELERNGLFDEAIVWYHKGLDADTIVESFYQGLMRCYAGLDRRTESIAVYRRLRQTLSITLGIPPSSSTEKLYQTVRDGH